MGTIEGNGGDYGVIGTGVPYTYTDQDGNTQFVNSVGVFGVLGSTAEDVQNYRDATIDNLNGPISAGVVWSNGAEHGDWGNGDRYHRNSHGQELWFSCRHRPKVQ